MPSAAAALATAALLVAAAGGAAAQNGGNAMATDSNNHTMTTNLTNVPLPPATSAHNHSAHDHGTGMVRKARAVGRGDRGGACVVARARKQPRSDDAGEGCSQETSTAPAGARAALCGAVWSHGGCRPPLGCVGGAKGGAYCRPEARLTL